MPDHNPEGTFPIQRMCAQSVKERTIGGLNASLRSLLGIRGKNLADLQLTLSCILPSTTTMLDAMCTKLAIISGSQVGNSDRNFCNETKLWIDFPHFYMDQNCVQSLNFKLF